MPKFKQVLLSLLPLLLVSMPLLVLVSQSPLPAQAAGPDSEGDIQLSFTGANLPEIAANSTFAAVVYAYNSQVYLRATQGLAGWWAVSVPVGNGTAPRLAFKPGTDTLHVVWASTAGDTIYHRSFLLNAESASGGDQHIVAAGTGLTTPDIVVDNANRLHVVWASGAGLIQSRVSSDEGVNWSNIASLGSSASQPVLAVSNSFVHLAFVNIENISGSDRTVLRYYRSSIPPALAHSWGDTHLESFPPAYNDIRSPAIAATSGGKVLLAWDSDRNDSANDVYGLISTSSSDNGGSWLSEPQHITATGTVYSGPAGSGSNSRLSKPRVTSPNFEAGLRPSLAVTGTNFAVVWQQRPETSCSVEGLIPAAGPVSTADTNGTAEIYFAAPSPNWTSTEILGSDPSTYAVDPDIAYDNSGVRHVVFLKATGVNCAAGGGSLGYAVYYRGPFTNVQPPVTYLPLIQKNS